MSDIDTDPTVVLWEAKAKPGREAELKAMMTDAVTASRHDAGCIDYEAYEVGGQPGTFIIYEKWMSREALRAHLRTERMQASMPQLLELMEGSFETGARFLRAMRPAQ